MSRFSEPTTRRTFTRGAVAAGVTLLAGCLGGGEEPDETETEPHPRLRLNGHALSSAFPIELVEPDAENIDGHASGDERIGSVHWHEDEAFSHWHFAPLEVPNGDSRRVRVRFVGSDLEEIPVGEDEDFQVDVFLTEASPEGFLTIEQTEDLLEFSGIESGAGTLGFELLEDGEVVWEAPELSVEVGDDAEEQ